MSKIIHSSAPVRICDNGGWTDTWFAKYGEIFNIAVQPRVEVRIDVFSDGESGVWLELTNYHDRYFYRPGMGWDRHPLIEAAIDSMSLSRHLNLQIQIASLAPAGAGTGTSAALTVALLAALDRLTPGSMTHHELAYHAWRVETEYLGQQSGIQDQLAAACGGINYIEVTDFPHAIVTQIKPSRTVLNELQERLALVYLGRPHHSSQIHDLVITDLEAAGPDCPPLKDLRRTAKRSCSALMQADFSAFGQVMIDNTAAQERLHPGLIGNLARQVIEIARSMGAAGWKVNGAGGDGGSLTILAGNDPIEKHKLIREIESRVPGTKNIPISLALDGVRVTQL